MKREYTNKTVIQTTDTSSKRTYTDIDGYLVTELTSPNKHVYIMTREKNGIVYYCYKINGTTYKGCYNKEDFEKEMARINLQLDQFSRKMNTALNEWDKEIQKYFNNFSSTNPSSLPTSPTLDSEFDFGNEFSNLFTQKTSSSFPLSTTSSNQSLPQKDGSCIGCFLWTVFLLGIFCVILYAMGCIGGNIIHFIIDCFKSLF